ncbi:YjbQ family protein [Alginatibacterium sediminis]|uniref:YjbQ family protein n=1 Tax=Alginatibacterium sediminis TaxID=2164068 RepID=A0A420E795_9ALTE|nr:secondary thiamine-phosphate synthase enzyme YjbQ [Alginatibacterium sediminis]RKF13325.1 YjbQ family protein [Alginatibacterium sediminis]
MSYITKKFALSVKARGFHLIDDQILAALPEISTFKVGICNLVLQHTSASLSLNENADATVRGDLERFFNHLLPEPVTYFDHNYEGYDDMPAHVKSSLLGVNLTLNIVGGQLQLGTWQGIYLGEHRDNAGARVVSANLHGELY